MVNGVFDHVPEELPDGSGNTVTVTYPYVVIGEPYSQPSDTKTTRGEEVNLTLHAWSEYEGKREIYQILNACTNALKYRLDIEGFSLEKVSWDNMRVFDDIDPRYKHGVLIMRYTLKNN